MTRWVLFKLGKSWNPFRNLLCINPMERHVGEIDDGIDSSRSSHGATNSLDTWSAFKNTTLKLSKLYLTKCIAILVNYFT